MVFGIFTASVMNRLCFPASASRSASQTGIWLKLFVFFLAGFSSLFYSSSVFAQNSLTALRLGSVEIDGQTALRLVVETAAPQPARMLLLSDPYRLVLDYQDMEWAVEGLAPSGQIDHLSAIAYRFGHPQPDAGRLVIELSSPASPERAFTLPPNRTGHRLVIDLMDRGEISFSLAQKALASGSFQPAAQTAAQNTLPPPTGASNLQSGAPVQASLSGRPVTIGVPPAPPEALGRGNRCRAWRKRPGRDWQAR